MAEALDRPDAGAGAIWSPRAGGGSRPSSVYARGVVSLATADIEMDSLADAKPGLDQRVHHFVFSVREQESPEVSDETLIRAVEMVLEDIGLGEHQAVFSVHRDTPRAHVHVAVCALNPFTLRDWDTYRDYYKLARAMRKAEMHFGLRHDHGAAVVQSASEPPITEHEHRAGSLDERLRSGQVCCAAHDGPEYIRWATAPEKRAWKLDKVDDFLEGRARKFAQPYADFEDAESWVRDIVAPQIDRIMRKRQSDGEPVRAIDIYAVAAAYGVEIELLPDRRLRFTVADPIDKPAGTTADADIARDGAKVHEPTLRRGLCVDLPADQIVGERSPVLSEESARTTRAETLSHLPTLTDAQLQFIGVVRRDPGLVAREIVKGGRALFGLTEIYQYLDERLPHDVEMLDELVRYVQQNDRELVVRTPDTPNPMMTTKDQLALEERVAQKAAALAAKGSRDFDQAALDEAIRQVEKERGITLSDEQHALLEGVRHRLVWINGDAGTGKTTCMDVLRRYAALTNRQIAGYTTSENAAKKLAAEGGFTTVNTAKARVIAEQGKLHVLPRSLQIFDETSMVDLKDFELILDLVADNDAIIVGIGDKAQLPAIDAGFLFDVVDDAMATAGRRLIELTEVRRQRGSLLWMRDTVPAAGRAIRDNKPDAIADAFSELSKRSMMQRCEDRTRAISDAVNYYMRARELSESVLLLAGDKLTCKHLDHTVRMALGLEGQGVRLHTRDFGHLELAIHDRIVFLKNDKKLGVHNNLTGTVTGIYQGSRTRVVVRTDDGAVIVFNPKAYRDWKYGYALTIHKAQGATVDRAAIVIDKSVTAEMLHVATTRARDDFRIFYSRANFEDDAELIQMAADRAGLKDDALLFERIVAQTGGPDSPWARRVKMAAANEADPLRQAHRQYRVDIERAFRAESDRANARYHAEAQRLGANATIQEKRELVARHRSAIATIRRQYRPLNFLEWAAVHRHGVEHDQRWREFEQRTFKRRPPEHERHSYRRDERTHEQQTSSFDYTEDPNAG
jgi:hypothetical protein